MKFKCSNVSKAYGSIVALRDVEFSLEKGEIRGILGGNGSGKSTLAKIIGGVVTKDKGEMWLDDKPYNVKIPSQAMKKRVVMTSQELSLLMNLTIEENLTITNIPRKNGVLLNRKEMRKIAMEMLEYIGMQEQANEMVADLPPNKQYMIEFAKALLQEPELLIVDEITSALFREDVELVSKIFRELSAKGCSIMFITHRIPEIFSMCSAVTVMRNGCVVATLNVKEVEENKLLGLLTGGTFEEEMKHIKEQCDDDDSRQNMLSVKNMHLSRFKNSIDLDVKAGEIIGIAGLQGQGQSDLVRGLFALDGSVNITIDNDELILRSPQDAVKNGLAYISGDRAKEGAFYHRAIDENLNCVNNVLKRGKLDDKNVLTEMTVKYNSSSDAIESLSGGNQQKVIIGRWIATKPKVVLADDLTKGIDVKARKDVHTILNNLAKEGSAVLYVSSDEEELVDLSHLADYSKVIVFYNGSIVKTLKGDEITLQNLISASIPTTGGVSN